MPQELILLDDVEDLGEIGQTVRVADGYARNYLLPRGLAAKATPGALRQLEARKVARQERLVRHIGTCGGTQTYIFNATAVSPQSLSLAKGFQK